MWEERTRATHLGATEMMENFLEWVMQKGRVKKAVAKNWTPGRLIFKEQKQSVHTKKGAGKEHKERQKMGWQAVREYT